MSFTDMIGSVGIVGLCVMGFLVVLSLYSVGVIVDKYRLFRSSANESSEFLPVLGDCMKSGDVQDVFVVARQHSNSHVARVVSAGVSELIESKEALKDSDDRVEFASRALSRSSERTLAEMKKGLGGLATIASTAPFIGLFGTVVGIINAFQGIAATGSGGIAAVSGGIAEALIATAMGILVAMPAVMGFNYFTGLLERYQVEINGTAAELVDFLTKRERMAHANR